MTEENTIAELKEMLRNLSKDLHEERGEFRTRLSSIQGMAQSNKDKLLVLEERDRYNSGQHAILFRKLDGQEKKWWAAMIAAVTALFGIILKILLPKF